MQKVETSFHFITESYGVIHKLKMSPLFRILT